VAYIVTILILATLSVLTALVMLVWANIAAYDLYTRTRSGRPGLGWRFAVPDRATRLNDIRTAVVLGGTLLGAGFLAAAITGVIAALGPGAGPWSIVILAVIAAVPGAAIGRTLGQRHAATLAERA